MPGILALDAATTTGWAHCEPGGDPQWGHKRMGQVGARDGVVFITFRIFLLSLVELFKPKVIVYEAPWTPRPDSKGRAKPLNPQTSRRLYGLTAHIDGIAEEYGIQCYEKPSASFVQFFTGRGRYPTTEAKKAATVAAAKARGWRATADEADALALLMFAESVLYPEDALRRRRTFKVPQGPLFAEGAA